MRIAIGSDHRGCEVKSQLIAQLQALGYEIQDVGTDNGKSVDYPEFAAEVARRVCGGNVDRGILICGTGIGMCIAANKFDGIRAAVCHDEASAELCRQHNDVNVLCLSATTMEDKPLDGVLKAWLSTDFEGGRHARRLEKIQQIEES